MDNTPCPAALFGALSLCRKAGALALGFDAAQESLKNGKAQLLLFTGDVSEKTRRRLTNTAPRELRIETLPCDMEALAVLARKPVGVLTVTDAPLAGLCLAKMQEE